MVLLFVELLPPLLLLLSRGCDSVALRMLVVMGLAEVTLTTTLDVAVAPAGRFGVIRMDFVPSLVVPTTVPRLTILVCPVA
uniref:Putative secreted protein n=1 Tax=Anopheles darlingi TaxID=43151 RepID=A0A2M4DC86_ANODA